MSVRISVVIPTHNRAEYLRKALRSLIDQTLPPDQFEIIVVDNASTDFTKTVVCQEFQGIENLRYEYEPHLGLCSARNKGWQEALGCYVAYLDDDAIACPKWLDQILLTFEQTPGSLGCVGGKVDLIWEAPRPVWLVDQVVPYLAELDWSKEPIVLNEEQYLAGVNFAFPKNVLREIGGFDPRIDRRGRNLLSNGDILILRKIQSKGYQCIYHPDIAVRHHVQVNRLTKKFFYRRAFWQGASDIVLDQLLVPSSRLSHLTRAASEFTQIGKTILGGNFTPRKIYWHLKTIPFERWCKYNQAVGRVRMNFSIALKFHAFKMT